MIRDFIIYFFIRIYEIFIVIDGKYLRIYFFNLREGWWMIKVRFCGTVRLVLFFENLIVFDFLIVRFWGIIYEREIKINRFFRIFLDCESFEKKNY